MNGKKAKLLRADRKDRKSLTQNEWRKVRMLQNGVYADKNFLIPKSSKVVLVGNEYKLVGARNPKYTGAEDCSRTELMPNIEQMQKEYDEKINPPKDKDKAEWAD